MQVKKTKAQMKVESGTPKIEAWPNSLNASMSMGTGFAFAIRMASPRATPSIPNVTRKGGIPVRETNKPLIKPIDVPMAIPPMMPGTRPRVLMTVAVVIELSARTAPWDRSIPAVRITKSWPMAKSPIIEY